MMGKNEKMDRLNVSYFHASRAALRLRGASLHLQSVRLCGGMQSSFQICADGVDMVRQCTHASCMDSFCLRKEVSMDKQAGCRSSLMESLPFRSCIHIAAAGNKAM